MRRTENDEDDMYRKYEYNKDANKFKMKWVYIKIIKPLINWFFKVFKGSQVKNEILGKRDALKELLQGGTPADYHAMNGIIKISIEDFKKDDDIEIALSLLLARRF